MPSPIFKSLLLLAVVPPLHAAAPPPQTSVGFDSRAILVDGVPRFLASGGFHYPRASVGSWRPIMQQMKANGLNAITTYAFWELHERQRGVYDWGQLRPEANVTAWLQTAQEEGLYVHMRIGPYINGNWNNGGFPAWLRDVEGIHFRTANEPFQREMGRWFRDFTDHIRPWLHGSDGGGPVLSLQVENEYSYSSPSDMSFIGWAAAMCANASRGQAICTMCNNTFSPTLPDFNNTIFTCNSGCNLRLLGGGAGETWIDGHKRAYPNQPSLFSEIEVADPQWSTTPCPESQAVWKNKNAAALSFEAARFVADGGTGTNYWMWFGGTNFRGGSNMPTTFMWSAPLGSFGRPNQPVFDHIGRMHKIFVQFERTLTGQRVVPSRKWVGHSCYGRAYGGAGTTLKPLSFWVNFGSSAVTIPADAGLGSSLLIAASGVLMVTEVAAGGGATVLLFNSSDVSAALAASTVGTAAATATAAAAPLKGWEWWGERLLSESHGGAGEPPIVRSQFPLDQLHLTQDRSDYCSYAANFTSVGPVCQLTMLVSDATIVYVWVDGTLASTADVVSPSNGHVFQVLDNSEHNSHWKTFSLQAPISKFVNASTHRLDLVSFNLGLNDDWPGPRYAEFGENAKKGIISNVSISCTDTSAAAPQKTTSTADAVAAEVVSAETCGLLTVQPITEKQAWLLADGLVHYQSKASGKCLGVAADGNDGSDMPLLVLVACDPKLATQHWALNASDPAQEMLVNTGLHGCTGGPRCALSQYHTGVGGYQTGDTIVLYGTDSGKLGTNQIVSTKVSPTGEGAVQLVVEAAGLCVTVGGKPPPPPPPPPGVTVTGWRQRNGTVGEWHRLFATSWHGWANGGPGSRPLVWLRAQFDAPPATAGGLLPLALRMGNATHGASKGRVWVNGFEIGAYWSRSLGGIATAIRGAAQQGSQLYLIPEDYLTADGNANTLVLFEDLGLAGGSSALAALEVVRTAQPWEPAADAALVPSVQ